jgi:NADPH2:quinone reductase
MTTMRAALYRTTGPAHEVLEVVDVERPEPGPGEVRVRIAVSGVNPTDVKNRAGFSARTIDGFQVPHMDGSGIVDAVGTGVDPSRVGQRVWLLLAADENTYATAAEFAVVPAHKAVPLPEGVALDLAATLGVPAVTAADCLFRDGDITGQDVLVSGGAGGVGRAAVQLAKFGGARVVTTVSTAEKAEIARAAGADLVVSYRDADVVEQIQAFSAGISRVVEVSLGANAAIDAAVVGSGAIVVSYATDGGDATIPARSALLKSTTYRYMLLYNLAPEVLARAVARVDAALRADALDLPPVQRFPLERVAEAQEVQEAGPVGRVLVDVAVL